MLPLSIGEDPVSLEAIAQVARAGRSVRLAPSARVRMERSRRFVERIVTGGPASPNVYGLNTGFGALAEVRISTEQIRALQRNLIRSHSAGVGAPLPAEIVRGMLLLRAQVLATGLSGVRPELCELLLEMLNHGVHPVIPSKGSVGASGD